MASLLAEPNWRAENWFWYLKPISLLTISLLLVSTFSIVAPQVKAQEDTVIKTIAGFSGPFTAAYNPLDRNMYVSNVKSNTVSVVDSSTNEIVRTIVVGTHPEYIAFNPANGYMYIGNGGDPCGLCDDTVVVLDTSTDTIVKTITGVGRNPLGIDFNTVNNDIYVATRDAVVVIDGSTHDILQRIPMCLALGVAFSPANGNVYAVNTSDCATVSVIDGLTNTVVRTIPVATDPGWITFNPSNGKIYVASHIPSIVSVIDPLTNTVATTVTVADATGVAFNSANNDIYVTGFATSTVSRIDSSTNTVVGTPIAVGVNPHLLGFNPSNNNMYVANVGDDTVSVISTGAPPPPPPPDFELIVTPESQTVTAGETATFFVTITPINGFSDRVRFQVSGLPSDFVSMFTPPELLGQGSSTLQVTPPLTALQNKYTLTVIAQSGTLEHNKRVTLDVISPFLKIELANKEVFGKIIIGTWDHSQLNVRVSPPDGRPRWFQSSYVDDVRNAIHQWVTSVRLFSNEFGYRYLDKITICTFVVGQGQNTCGNNFDLTITWEKSLSGEGGLTILRGLSRLSCRFTSATIVLGAKHADTGDQLTDMEMADLAGHEFGHFLGLGHAVKSFDVMAPQLGQLPVSTLDAYGLAVSWAWLDSGLFACPTSSTVHLPIQIPYQGLNAVVKIQPTETTPESPIRFTISSRLGASISIEIKAPDGTCSKTPSLVIVPALGQVQVTFPTDFVKCFFEEPTGTSSTGWYSVTAEIAAVRLGISWRNTIESGFTISPLPK